MIKLIDNLLPQGEVAATMAVYKDHVLVITVSGALYKLYPEEFL